jgi:CubicO group peptidase (beta-lactamase class C family)
MKRANLRCWSATAAVILFLTPGPASGQTYDLSTLEDLDGFAEELMEGWGVPGLAVGVISMKDGGAEYVRTFGHSDIDGQVPVTPTTIFGIGSCAKAFTAAAVAALVTDGALTWDTPVHELVPSFRLFDDYVTLHATPRDLLSHRTGLNGYDMLAQAAGGGRDGLWERARHLEPTEGFRERFQYSNLSYQMAGKLVEDVAGEPFEDFVHRRLLEPIGMESTTLSFRGHGNRSTRHSLHELQAGPRLRRRRAQVPGLRRRR